MRQFVGGLVALMLALPLMSVAEPSDLRQSDRPVVRLSPEIRESHRGSDYYQAIPCRELPHADAQTPSEQAHLEKRKRACLEKYSNFAPRSFLR